MTSIPPSPVPWRERLRAVSAGTVFGLVTVNRDVALVVVGFAKHPLKDARLALGVEDAALPGSCRWRWSANLSP